MRTCGEEKIRCEKATIGAGQCQYICERRFDGIYKDAVAQAYPLKDWYTIACFIDCMIDGVMYPGTWYTVLEVEKEKPEQGRTLDPMAPLTIGNSRIAHRVKGQPKFATFDDAEAYALKLLQKRRAEAREAAGWAKPAQAKVSEFNGLPSGCYAVMYPNGLRWMKDGKDYGPVDTLTHKPFDAQKWMNPNLDKMIAKVDAEQAACPGAGIETQSHYQGERICTTGIGTSDLAMQTCPHQEQCRAKESPLYAELVRTRSAHGKLAEENARMEKIIANAQSILKGDY